MSRRRHGGRHADEFEAQAMTLLTNPQTRDAFDLGKEDAATRDRYGRNRWGQQLLLARRLVESGVEIVTSSLSGPLCGRVGNWDDHAVNQHQFEALRFRMPNYDRAVSALIEDIYARGLDKRVLHNAVRLLTGSAADFLDWYFENELLKGYLASSGTIGSKVGPRSQGSGLVLLYHVIGGGTGDWDVPIGGMGHVSAELERAARAAGADLRAGADVTAVSAEGVSWHADGDEHHLRAQHVLWAAAPAVLDRLLGAEPEPCEGAQVKVNLLLSRLPRLRDGIAPEAAFGGTFHINESYSQLQAAYRQAALGAFPDPMPAEIYCHSLTDPSILGPDLRASGAHTLTVFALQVPDGMLAGTDDERADLQRRVLDSLSSVLDEPIDDVILADAHGRPCVETKTTRDLADALAMTGGNIFHGPLRWPFATDDEPLDSPARRWGVESRHEGILLAGAGTRRGGGVSGLGGYHAARAVLDVDTSTASPR